MPISRIINATHNYPLPTALLAGALSIALHFWVNANWHPAPATPLANKTPQVIEVALVTPPPPPPVEQPKIVQPKPDMPAPKKPVKVKEKTVPKPKPAVAVKPKPAPPVKAPPKVVQKTFVQAVPDFKEDVTAKITAPMPAPPTPVLPVKPSVIPSPAVKAHTPPSPAKPGNGGQGSGEKTSSGVVAIQRTLPRYPSRAANRHIEGHVTVGFTITPEGEVSNPKVISATPEDIFDDAALAAIEQWKFKPKIVNGVAVEQRAVQTLQFKLPK